MVKLRVLASITNCVKRYVLCAVLNLPSPCVIEGVLGLGCGKRRKEIPSLCPLHYNCIKKHKTASQYKKELPKI